MTTPEESAYAESVASFVEEIVRLFPTLRPMLDEHLDYHRRLLAHVFMGDVVAEWILPRIDEPFEGSEIEGFLRYLEAVYPTAPLAVQNLITVSFIENLGYETPLEERFGPVLREVSRDLWGPDS